METISRVAKVPGLAHHTFCSEIGPAYPSPPRNHDVYKSRAACRLICFDKTLFIE